jgi:hypothetical protein
MHHIRSSAINLSGNDHLVELNEAGRVVQESDDQGAVDMWGNPTFRGNVFRWNYFHHIGPWKNALTEPALGQAGIRLDDAISGVLIYQIFSATPQRESMGSAESKFMAARTI